MAKGLKWFVYVGIIQPDGTISVVTKVRTAELWASWGPGKGKKFTVSGAKEMAYCLSLNGFNATVIQSLYELSNPEKNTEVAEA